MRTIEREDANTAWELLIKDCLNSSIVAPRQQTTLELDGPVSITITDINKNLVTNPVRKMNYAFAIAEVLWIWQGKDDLGFIRPYNKAIENFSDNGLTLYGAY